MIALSPVQCPHWRLVADFGDCHRKRRLSPTVAEFRRQIVAEIGDYSLQCGQAIRETEHKREAGIGWCCPLTNQIVTIFNLLASVQQR